MTWIYENENLTEIPEGAIGFVYCITNTATNKKYIGKKLFHFTKTKQVKGKKKKIKVDSDWETYFGSNKELNEHVNLLGQDKFYREILRICYSKGEMTYYETKHIFAVDAVISDHFYNDWVMCRVRRSHIKKK
jgi:hypothetical protein